MFDTGRHAERHRFMQRVLGIRMREPSAVNPPPGRRRLEPEVLALAGRKPADGALADRRLQVEVVARRR
jgi:hypothetical protein